MNDSEETFPDVVEEQVPQQVPLDRVVAFKGDEALMCRVPSQLIGGLTVSDYRTYRNGVMAFIGGRNLRIDNS